jgi:Rps23 Pro-64 3,4-dihydroxylase Tpa1-like proline 4-hydroxylase
VEALRPIEEMINSRLKLEDKLQDKEIQLAVYNGDGEYYLRHKDAFRLDPNNIQDGQKMRKYTAIAYLNPDIEKIKQANPKA